MTDETALQRSNSVRSNDGVAECGRLGLSSSVYDHTEIRNNRGGKQPAVAQLVKTSRARNGELKDGQRRGEGFIGHQLACGLQIYRCGGAEG